MMTLILVRFRVTRTLPLTLDPRPPQDPSSSHPSRRSPPPRIHHSLFFRSDPTTATSSWPATLVWSFGRAGLNFLHSGLRGLIQCRPLLSRTQQQPSFFRHRLPLARCQRRRSEFSEVHRRSLPVTESTSQPLSLSRAWICRDGHERASFVCVDGAALN